MIRLLLPFALACMVLTACEGPLDTDTPRKVTPVTSAVKVKPSSVTPIFSGDYGTFEFDGDPVIEVDTTTNPVSIWISVAMVKDSATMGIGNSAKPKAEVRRFELHGDSVLADDHINSFAGGNAGKLDIYKGDPTGQCETYDASRSLNSMDMVIATQERTPEGRMKITMTIMLETNKAESMLHDITQQPLASDKIFGKIVIEL